MLAVPMRLRQHSPMSAQIFDPPTEQPSAGITLGDLLFADPAGRRPPEAQWVAVVQAIAARDPHALRLLYERTHRLVFTSILRITRNRETAEELTVDVFHDIWRRAGDYHASGGTVVGWIMNQARSRALDRLRYESRLKRVSTAVDLSSDRTDGAMEDPVEWRDRARQLHSAIAVLSTDERMAIQTAYFSDLSHTDVAARLNQPVGTVKTRIRSGLQKLRRMMDADLGPT
jgi:RNA polymerase sigma-70 factor (ECF subfamily)